MDECRHNPVLVQPHCRAPLEVGAGSRSRIMPSGDGSKGGVVLNLLRCVRCQFDRLASERPGEPHDARWFWPDWSRSLSGPFIQSSMSNHGPVRARRYHAASVLKYISGIIVPVNKSTIGYFKSVIRVSLRLPVIAVLPKSYLDGPTPNHLALHQKQPRMAESLHAGCIYACSYSGAAGA